MKKNKKDIFRKAIADNLSENEQEGSELGDFVSDMKRSRADSSGEASPGASAHGESRAPEEDKNDLPEQKEEKKTGSAMESRLKRLTSGAGTGAVQPAAFADDDEPPRWRKFALYGVAAVLALSLLYWAIFSPGQKPAIYLSNTAIEENNARNLSTTNLVFPRNKTLYLFFASGGRVGQDKLIIKLTEVYADSSNMMKEESVGQIENSVKSNWRYVTAHFQKEYLDHTGRFRIHVLSPNGEVLASQEFRIQ